jgi:hypothetical protein
MMNSSAMPTCALEPSATRSLDLRKYRKTKSKEEKCTAPHCSAQVDTSDKAANSSRYIWMVTPATLTSIANDSDLIGPKGPHKTSLWQAEKVTHHLKTAGKKIKIKIWQEWKCLCINIKATKSEKCSVWTFNI